MKTLILVLMCVGGFLTALVALTGLSPAQNTPQLQITAPASGTVVTPGQTVLITVTLAPGISFDDVIVFGQAPLPNTESKSSPPYQFSMVVPSSISPGRYVLTASGGTGVGTGIVRSAPITLIVQAASAIISMKSELSQLVFKFPGEQLPLLLTGTLSNGEKVNITKATTTTYLSNNPSVASVSATGLVTAVGGGDTDVIIRNGTAVASVAVSVAVGAPGDLDGDGDIDQDDLNVITEALNSLATGPFDCRDLNKDGKIDALDSRLLVNLCTRSRCAKK